MQAGFWKADWVLGGVVVALFALFGAASDLLVALERKAYDLAVQSGSRAPSDQVAVIAIDKQSVDNIGRWPWSRDTHARMIEILAQGKAKAVGYLVFFAEPENESINRTLAKLIDAAAPASAEAGPPNPLLPLLKDAEEQFNTDRKLAASVARAGNVVLPLLFVLEQPRGRAGAPLPQYIRRNAVAGDTATRASGLAISVLEPLGSAAAGLGHLNVVPDADGAVRVEAPVVAHFGEAYPSLAVMLVAKSLNLGAQDVRLAADSVQLGGLKARTDADGLLHTYFYRQSGERPPIAEDSFFDVLSGKIAPEKYRDKIVLVGPTAAGIANLFVTPVHPALAAVSLQAQSVSSLLQEQFFVVPAWARFAEWLLLAAAALYVVALLPRLRAGAALAATAAGVIVLVALHFVLMAGGLWLQLMAPAALLVLGHAALASKRFIVTERAKVDSDATSAESNRMLALAYQGQGQLDLAWDKFRQVPLSNTVLDNLYGLGLDFERKRQFNKAEAVFRYVHEFKADFKDVATKLARARELAETVLIGASHPGGSLQLNVSTKPRFGRFEVEKELGKGAMGVVYLGKDPKIGREVAVKTLALSEQFQPEEMAEVKERFFREAQTAGRLSHPNIVTIYDTGEEHDYCYIAMELLRGASLAPYTKAGQLLPQEKVVSIVARAADALGYAHREGVVHRDVKPANIMYDPASDTLKLTDFGIARLTASSKTKTGMVLGTPSYMSPEQLAGKKIDGRSDLFSLAVTLYQLLSGRLPFEAESMAQLMFRIANEAPTSLTSVASVPAPLARFVERALAKSADERFQSGEHFAGELRAALSEAPQPAAAST